LNGKTRLAIGVELTGRECIATLTDLYAEPLHFVRYAMLSPTIEASIDIVVQAIIELMEGYDPVKLLGVAVGVPGPVDEKRQRVIQAENIAWLDVPLGPMLTERLKKPVVVVKRTNAGALGEYWYGIGKGHHNLIYVSVGLGIGSGLIIQGQLYEGDNGSAGEIGHITVVPDGHRCKCGNFGCLETLASRPAIAIRAKEKIKKEGRQTLLTDWTKQNPELITGRMVLDAAAEGDALAIEVVQEAGRYLGIALANVINLFNPSLVVIGGEVAELGDLFLNPIREVVRSRTFSIPLACVQVVPSTLGYGAAAIGAATLVIDRFFTSADLTSSSSVPLIDGSSSSTISPRE
jgi:glucokinase-like ROK family protein